jgi:hypothetical protein
VVKSSSAEANSENDNLFATSSRTKFFRMEMRLPHMFASFAKKISQRMTGEQTSSCPLEMMRLV